MWGGGNYELNYLWSTMILSIHFWTLVSQFWSNKKKLMINTFLPIYDYFWIVSIVQLFSVNSSSIEYRTYRIILIFTDFNQCLSVLPELILGSQSEGFVYFWFITYFLIDFYTFFFLSSFRYEGRNVYDLKAKEKIRFIVYTCQRIYDVIELRKNQDREM